MIGSAGCRPLLLILLAFICTENASALDPNKAKASLPDLLSGKLGELIKNKSFQSDSSSFNLNPDGGFELSWDWNKQKGAAASTKKSFGKKSSSSSNSNSNNIVANLALMGSLSCWLYASWVALMTPHPNPAVAATLPLRHDILTFSQAVAFQVPILVAAFTALKQNLNSGQQQVDVTLHRRLLLGIGTMSLWTGAGIFFGKTFSRGYELFSTETRYAIGGTELAIAIWAFGSWTRWVPLENSLLGRLLIRGPVGSLISLLTTHPGTNHKPLDNPDDPKSNDIALYTASTMGLLGLAILPQLTSFPTATIPTILGKRFSRAASGITFLASVIVYCVREASIRGSSKRSSSSIQTLRTGLAIGSIGHLFLVVGKLVGIDGGGLLMEGDGLWEFYPSMVNAARAVTTLMLATFFTTAYVCTR